MYFARIIVETPYFYTLKPRPGPIITTDPCMGHIETTGWFDNKKYVSKYFYFSPSGNSTTHINI